MGSFCFTDDDVYKQNINAQFYFFFQVKPAGSTVPKGLTPPLDPSDPFADDEKERREVEELARKFESKYVSSFHINIYFFGINLSFLSSIESVRSIDLTC